VDWSTLRGLLIDLDGVLYTGREPIAGAGEFLARARRHGLKFLLITNNSTTSPQVVSERLRGMQMQVAPEEILTSAQAAVAYVRRQSPNGARVQVIGEAGLLQEVRQQGFEVSLTDNGQPVDWVIVGLDRAFDYQKLTRATRAILAGARFVATNADALLPIEGGQVLPGAGTMIAAIQAATGIEPVVVGKPEPGLFAHGLERLGNLPPETVAMVGDRLDTDMAGGRRAGLRTVLVLSGVTTPEQLFAAEMRPDAVLPNLAALPTLLGWAD
jgi:4-nitrophenyl phosphatase